MSQRPLLAGASDVGGALTRESSHAALSVWASCRYGPGQAGFNGPGVHVAVGAVVVGVGVGLVGVGVGVVGVTDGEAGAEVAGVEVVGAADVDRAVGDTVAEAPGNPVICCLVAIATFGALAR